MPTPQSPLHVEYLPVADLIPYARNSRTHSEIQVGQIAASIREFGFTNPILISPDNDIIAGHGRALAAAKLGLGEAPCIRLGHLTDTQRRAYVIADNKLALNSGWDTALLSIELADLKVDDFNLDLLGFDADELDALLNPELAPTDGLTDPDGVPENVDTRCKPGDLWVLGKHRLLCGDSTNIQHVEKLMAGEKADMVFTDPPYGVGFKYDSHEDKGGDAYAAFIREIWHVLLTMGCPIVLTPGNCNLRLWLSLADFKTACWIKKNAMSPSSIAYLNIFEILLLYGVSGRRSTDVFEYPIKMQPDVGDHPCPKLLALVEDVLDSWAPSKGLLFEPFAGSGTTLIACEKTNRRCFGMEIDPKYCDVILTRWEKFTGQTAELADE